MKIIVDIEGASVEETIETMERIKDIAIVKDIYLEESINDENNRI